VTACITGATVITPEAILPAGLVTLDSGVIVDVLPGQTMPPGIEATLDASELILAPGFVELQINGGFGIDLTAEPARLWQLGERLPEVGVTAFLPTIVSSPPVVASHARDVVRAGPPLGYRGATSLGLHLEGPFIAPTKCGAHDPANLRAPSMLEAQAWTATEGVAMVTLAPELDGALELIGELSRRGVLVSAGHSAADLATGEAAIEAGVRYGTHLFNAMTGLDHRSPGLAAALLDDERVTVGLIADGIHVHPEMVRLVSRLAGPDRISLVSDAIAGLGMSPGRFKLGNQEVIVDESSARLADGTLAGSILRLDQALRNFVAFTGCRPEVALRAVTSVPARLLGVADRHGAIVPGSLANLVLLTRGLEVVATIVGGRIAYASDGAPAWE
jgi:N-acetylglucosamine-6-phosphate deacetylase